MGCKTTTSETTIAMLLFFVDGSLYATFNKTAEIRKTIIILHNLIITV